jgi:hypothetical protein
LIVRFSLGKRKPIVFAVFFFVFLTKYFLNGNADSRGFCCIRCVLGQNFE